MFKTPLSKTEKITLRLYCELYLYSTQLSYSTDLYSNDGDILKDIKQLLTKNGVKSLLVLELYEKQRREHIKRSLLINNVDKTRAQRLVSNQARVFASRFSAFSKNTRVAKKHRTATKVFEAEFSTVLSLAHKFSDPAQTACMLKNWYVTAGSLHFQGYAFEVLKELRNSKQSLRCIKFGHPDWTRFDQQLAEKLVFSADFVGKSRVKSKNPTMISFINPEFVVYAQLFRGDLLSFVTYDENDTPVNFAQESLQFSKELQELLKFHKKFCDLQIPFTQYLKLWETPSLRAAVLFDYSITAEELKTEVHKTSSALKTKTRHL